MSDSSAGQSERTIRAVVVGRACGEQIWLRTDDGAQMTIRVGGKLWRDLDLGTTAEVVLGDAGRPRSVRSG